MFVQLPGIELKKWPQEVLNVFRNTMPQYWQDQQPWLNFMYYDITGMTFSGHPFTTYFNTSASLAYGNFYLYDSGLHLHKHFMWAAGDDLVIWHIEDVS